MSTTIEMTSPSSSIVVVDKSGSAEANNLIQTNASQHHLYHHPHQSHQIHAQQVIVNEEYLSGDSIVTAGNINYLKTNDLLSSAQIIQSTASFDFGTMRAEAQLIPGRYDGKTALHHHQQHQPKGVTTQDDQYHGAKTVLPQTITNPNSKVHVISNVTLVSKAQQPHHQSISFVSSGKHVHATTAATHTHTVPMAKAASVTGKIINIPYKNANVAHVQQLQPQSQTQSNQSHMITKHLNNPSAIIQKIPIPRNIHVLSAGRIQNQQHHPPPPPQQQHHLHQTSDESATITHTQMARNAVSSHQTTANVIQIQKQHAIGKSNLNLAPVKTATTAATKKHQTVKLINQATSVVTPQGNQQYTIQSQHVPLNHQLKTKQAAQQRVFLTSTYNNDYHYQHAGVQQSNEHANKNGPEYFRVNTSDIQSTTSTFVDNIPLISARTDDAAGYQQHGGANDQDDDVVGEEVRPLPIDSSMDSRMRALHALLQDHTYVQLPKKNAIATAAPVTAPVMRPIGGQFGDVAAIATTQIAQGKSANAAVTYAKQHQHPQQLQQQQQQHQQKIQQNATTFMQDASGSVSTQPPHPSPHAIRSNLTQTNTLLPKPYGINQSSIESSFIPGFPFAYNAMGKDDDANSVISTGSRNNLDIDLGEETETAPEGEGEDDSVTRCICELAHDDGYMICCDKCSVWQHVDCMGIDRQNIPEEYKCELCQPRPVDHNRARTLQLMKRKEQQNFMLLGSASGSSATPLSPNQQQHRQPMSLTGQLTVNERSIINERTIGGNQLPSAAAARQAHDVQTPATRHAQDIFTPITRHANDLLTGCARNKKGRKAKGESGSSSASKRKRADLSAMRAASAKQRREAKKLSKRKSASNANIAPSNASSMAANVIGLNATTPLQSPSSDGTTPSASSTSDKQASNLRAWIENYEAAMTNHYSPELRARLHAMGKQTQGQNSNTIASILKHVGSPENKCTTVPHAGGKILISTLDIYPKNPVIEMRGKYMLGTQYQAQQQTATMAALTVANGTVPSKHTAGPFLFFYRLPNEGPEICVDTRTYGNEARFVRRSCRPNAEILHTIEKGTLHLYIVSLATIKSSTEITIKHEPHDLEWLARGELTAPTSTICACGLIKECLFGAGGAAVAPNANPNAMPASITSSKSLSTAAQKKLSKRSNGHIKDKNSSSLLYHRKKKSSSSTNRNRSRSSSSDHASKALHNNCEKRLSANVAECDGSAVNAIAVVSAEVTSAANALNALASSPKQRTVKVDEIIATGTAITTTLHQKSPEKPNHVVFGIANGTCHGELDHTSISPVPVSGQSLTSPRPVFDQTLVAPEAIAVADTPNTPDKTTDDKQLKSPPLTPLSSNQRLSIVAKPLSHKKSARKSTCSLSEDNSSVAGDDFAVSTLSPNATQFAGTGTATGSATKKEKEPKKVVENKKMTREERKMEAIVRAFEKMEKTEQRKNEQNKKSHPTGSGAISGIAISNASISSRKRSISSSQKDKIDDEKLTPIKRSSLQQGRRKRKRGKSYSQSNHQRRRRTRNDSQNSEIGTSEDSTTFMMSPTLPSPVSFDHDPRLRDRRQSDFGLKKSSDSDIAADLLLSLSSYGSSKNTSAEHLSPPSKSNATTTGLSAFPISSACLLIEAAVGPLGHDFKLPTKAKTKKSIMNDWLHQSDASAAHSPHSDSADQHMLSPNPTYGGANSYHSMHHDAKTNEHINDDRRLSVFMKQPDHSISMAAQKIEEFIQLSAAASSSADHIADDDESSSKWSGSNDVQTVPTPMPTPPLQLGSSVKKRWLRQAISEECSDEMLANSSATSSPPNGFMAPLKKRRVARQCSDLNAIDDLPSPVLSSSHDAAEEKPSFIDRLDIDMTEEESSNAAADTQVPTPIEVGADCADDEPACVSVKEETKAEPIESKPIVEVVEEIKSEDIKAEHSETRATVEDVIDSHTEQQKVEIKMEIDVDVEAEEKIEVDEEKPKPITEAKPNPIAGPVEQKHSAEDPVSIVDSGSSTAIEKVEHVEREHERVEQVEKAEIVKIQKIEDTDNNNTEYPSVTALHDVPLPKDEIEDIQQKLHSFHSENLMILQSRNKKRLSRATTPTSFDVEPKDLPPAPPSSSSSSLSSSSASTSPPKCRKTSIERDHKIEEPAKRDNEKISPSSIPASSSYPAAATVATKKSLHSTSPNSVVPTLLNKSTPNVAYSSHWMQRSADGVEMYQQQPSMVVPPPTFNAIHPHLGAVNASTPNSLYHYLENPNRPTNYTTMAYATPSNVLTADQSLTTRTHSMFGPMHPNIPAPTLLNSSNYLTKSYSTLSEPKTAASIVPSPALVNLTPTTLTPKVLTRTQSADPRLNPPKDLPPVTLTPKRKMSINEYRMRKLISGGASGTIADKAKTPETPTTPDIETNAAKTNALDAVKPKNGLAATSETKETVFSPAPTLLELQQESLSQRLKSYKSLQEMSTPSLVSSKLKDATTENDELNLLRNLEPSSNLSSSTSSSLRSSPSLKSFDGDDNSNSFNEPNEPCRDGNIEANDFLTNDIRLKNTTCATPPAKQSSITSAVTSNENDACEPTVDNEHTSHEDVTNFVRESQTKYEPTSAGNISPNENTSR